MNWMEDTCTRNLKGNMYERINGIFPTATLNMNCFLNTHILHVHSYVEEAGRQPPLICLILCFFIRTALKYLVAVSLLLLLVEQLE